MQYSIANIPIYFIFIIHRLSNFIMKQWRIFLIAGNKFVGVKLVKNVKYSLIEKTALIISIFTLKYVLQVEKLNSTVRRIYISFFVVSN